MTDEYKKGDRVFVEMPGGKRAGTVAEVLQNYDWNFETIASARVITACT